MPRLKLTGFTVAIIGLFVSLNSNTIEGAWPGLVLAGIGLLITVANQDIFDLSPVSPLNAVEEVVSTAAVGAAVATLAADYGR
ncbi:MAG TPA: hypothetical protein VNP71_10815 [Thermoplasmata archaeon]|nr:hypothetical protein [Thermoplasmata archaeon]